MAAALPPRPEDNLPLGSSNPWDNLPIELFDYLLSGLTLNVLIRCRIVCKVWFRNIDCLYPWMKYCVRSAFLGLSLRNHKILEIKEKKYFDPGNTCIFGCSADDEITGVRIFGMVRRGDEMIPEHIASFPQLRGFRHGIPGKVSTSNGLILLERQDKSRILESVVVDPLMKEMVVVPRSPYQPVAFDNLTLGYNTSSGSHKLIQQLVRDENNSLGAAIYNLRGMSWRFIPFPDSLLESSNGAFDNQDQKRRGGVCISATLFWTLHGPTRTIMVFFDLRRESFFRLSMPMRHLGRYEVANVGSLTLWDLTFGDKIEIWSFVLGPNKRHLWIRSWVMFLNGPIHTTDNVTGVYHHGRDSLLIRGRCSSTGESLFVMQHKMDRFSNCILKDRFWVSWMSIPIPGI